MSYPPHFPDLNPCDYFPYGFLKHYVFRNNVHMVKELKAEITVAVENINTETLTAVMENFS
jgi:hypothetical protein